MRMESVVQRTPVGPGKRVVMAHAFLPASEPIICALVESAVALTSSVVTESAAAAHASDK
jgi:hypothetical protein